MDDITAAAWQREEISRAVGSRWFGVALGSASKGSALKNGLYR